MPFLASRSIRMAIEGRSSASGRHPDWLNRASDIRFCGISGTDDTVLHFEAPILGEAAEALYAQGEFWPTKPDPEQTALDVFQAAAADIATANADSMRFDRRLLSEFALLGHALNGHFQQIDVLGRQEANDRSVTINQQVIEIARRLKSTTPAAQWVRITGTLDMVRVSTQGFALRLKSGEEVNGLLPNGDIHALKEHLGKVITASGRCIFRASGRPLRIEAEDILPEENVDTIWTALPKPRTGKIIPSLRQPQTSRTGINAIIGQWPGDETDEEIAEALREIS